MSVNDYMDRFDEAIMHCDIRDEPWVTITKFVDRLQLDIKREVELHTTDTLEEAFHKAIEVEKYLKTSTNRHTSFYQPMDS